MNGLGRPGTLMAATAILLAGCGGSEQPALAVSQPVETPAVPAPVPAPAPAPAPPPSQITVPPETPIILADDIFYSRGSYIAYASPWCAIKNKALVVGQDLVDSITLYPSTFPGNVEIRAKAPWANPWNYGCGVYGYHHIAFGNYDGGFPNDAVEPRQVRNLKALEVDFAVSFTKVAGDYNLLHEFYLTTKAGAHKEKIVEIGFFLHASPTAVTFAKTGLALGPYTDPSGRQWSIFQEKKFVMLFPADGQDVGAGTLDMKHVLDVLVTKGVISGEEWFNGVAIGIEPVQGDSKVDIGRWTVRLA